MFCVESSYRPGSEEVGRLALVDEEGGLVLAHRSAARPS